MAVVLASLLVPHDDPTWQVWWLDSNQKPDDIAMLEQWGFGNTKARKLLKLNSDNGPVELQAQEICRQALKRRNVLVVIDEYKHLSISARRAGVGIEGVHLRGRGLNVGMLGLTQEPVDIPRQLLSQANHLFLFDVHYPADIKYVRTLYEDYERPPAITTADGVERRTGFYHCFIDGDADWRFYPHVKAWRDKVAGVDDSDKVPA